MMKTTVTTTTAVKPACIGSICHGSLRSEDLLSEFISELEWQLGRNGDYFSRPENHQERDRLNAIVGEAQDCFDVNGETIDDEKRDEADELINETIPDALQSFCSSFIYFGSHPGDGSDFGYWPCEIDDIKEQVEFTSRKDQEYPEDDFTGEWLHVNERGNCTLYLRTNSIDTEIWSIA